ncbi:MAG: M48 family metallopeptidase [Chloroflexota bacterium]
MDPLATTPRIIAWLPTIAVILAVIAVFLAIRARRADPDAAASLPVAVLPIGLLAVAAIAAIVSTAAEAVVDSRVGLREGSTFALALLFGTPVAGWLATRMRWGRPGNRTFYQQIAANRTSSGVLLVTLAEVLALTGFVIGGSIGLLANQALAAGLLFGAIALVGGGIAAVIASARGSQLVLDAVGAKPIGDRQPVLANVVAELALAAGIPAPAVYLIDDPAPNALSVGRDSAHAALAVTTGLLEKLDREELQAVVAHELGHIRNLDSRYGVLIAVLVGAVVILADGFAGLMSHMTIDADGLSGLIIAILVWLIAFAFGLLVRACATVAARALQASVSREREYLADATAVELTRNPRGLIQALEVVGRATVTTPGKGTQHLWFAAPAPIGDGFFADLMATHPWPIQRIRRLQAVAGIPEPSPRPAGEPPGNLSTDPPGDPAATELPAIRWP